MRVIAIEALSPVERNALLDAVTPLDGILVQLGDHGSHEASLIAAVEDADVMKSFLRSVGRSIAIARPDHYIYGTASSADEALALVEDLRSRIYSRLLLAGEGRERASQPGG